MSDRGELLATADAVRTAVGLIKRRVQDERISGVSPAETVVLSRLDRNGPATIADLARWQGVTPQAMGATVAALEAQDLLARQPDPNDGRRLLLSPTPRGRELLRDARAATTELLADALAKDFSAGEIALIHAAAPLIERLAQLL
jgi:DNA-binding MarR family transcriptional regulator